MFIFRIDQFPPHPIFLEPIGGNCDIPDCYVRQCAFSDDGSILITVDDLANVVQYDREISFGRNETAGHS